MLPFSISLKTGSPVSEQVLYAVKKAIVSGQMRLGDKFPSVRVLSQELKINPNTAQKIISILLLQNLLELRPGIGTTVAAIPKPNHEDCRKLLEEQIERLVVDAKKLQMEMEDVCEALAHTWKALS